MKIIIIFSLVVASLADSTNYTFQYSATDVIVIPFGNVVDLSSSLATSQFQEAEDGDISLTQSLEQISNNSNQVVLYNIIYFNLTDEAGSTCYYNYFNNVALPSNVTSCTLINNTQLSSFQVGCINFTNCSKESFMYSITLEYITYKQSIIMIENNSPSNADAGVLYLGMQTNVNVLNSNVWFYWSVALTCLLLLSLVLLTGVVLYWSLKYRKAQRALQELRLTQVDQEAAQIRKSMHKSIIKQQ